MALERPFSELVNRLTGRLWEDAPATPQGRPAQQSAPQAQPAAVDPAPVAKRLENLLEQRKNVVAGKLHLLNLDVIRNRLGPSWEGKAERIAAVIERTLTRHLSPHDYFRRLEDGAYVVIFDHLPEQEAQVKCELVGREVLSRLFGEGEDLPEVSLQTAVASVDSSVDLKGSNGLAGIATLLDQADQRWIKIGRGGTTVTSTEEVVVDKPERPIPPPAESAAPGPDVETLLHQAERNIANWQVHLPPQGQVLYTPDQRGATRPAVVAAAANAAKAAKPKPKVVVKRQYKSVEFEYWPYWFAPRNAVTCHRGEVVFQSDDGPIPSDQYLAETDVPDSRLTIDRMIWRRGLADLAQLLSSGAKALLMLPLHLSTWETPGQRRQIETLAVSLTDQMRSLVQISLLDCLERLGQRDLQISVAKLSTLSRAVIARVPLAFYELDKLRDTGFTGLEVDLKQEPYAETELQELMRHLAAESQKRKLQTYLTGVGSTSKAIAGIAAGFDFLSGSAISQAVEKPQTVASFDLFDIYRPRMR